MMAANEVVCTPGWPTAVMSTDTTSAPYAMQERKPVSVRSTPRAFMVRANSPQMIVVLI